MRLPIGATARVRPYVLRRYLRRALRTSDGAQDKAQCRRYGFTHSTDGFRIGSEYGRADRKAGPSTRVC